MKISSQVNNQVNLNNNRSKKEKDNVSFKNGGFITSLLVNVNKYEVTSAMITDVSSMAFPRTIIDMTRNVYAGLETMRRELSSVTVNASIGLVGFLTAGAIALGLKNKQYDVSFPHIHADHETIDGFAKTFAKICKENPDASKQDIGRKFLTQIFNSAESLTKNTDKDSTVKAWNVIKPESRLKIVDGLIKQIDENPKFKLTDDAFSALMARLNNGLDSTKEMKLNLGDKTLTTNGISLINDSYSLTKAFLKDNVFKHFKNVDDVAKNPFIKDLKRLGTQKTIIGLALMMGIGSCVQLVNRLITQKQTGIVGFVGDPNYNKDNKKEENPEKVKAEKAKFKVLKYIAAVAMGAFVVKTIGPKNPRDFLSKIQFRSALPTINQLKVIYGATIIGRILASSDKTELRETSTRDFLGFANWLILGGVVTKLFVNSKDKNLITFDEKTHGKGLWNWLKKASVKTQNEVIADHFKDNMFKPDGTVLKTKELYKNGWIKPDSVLDNKLKVLNKGQLIGILYSCLALGVFIPLLNKYITERGAKKKNQQEETPAVQVNTPVQTQATQTKQKIETPQVFAEFMQAS